MSGIKALLDHARAACVGWTLRGLLSRSVAGPGAAVLAMLRRLPDAYLLHLGAGNSVDRYAIPVPVLDRMPRDIAQVLDPFWLKELYGSSPLGRFEISILFPVSSGISQGLLEGAFVALFVSLALRALSKTEDTWPLGPGAAKTWLLLGAGILLRDSLKGIGDGLLMAVSQKVLVGARALPLGLQVAWGLEGALVKCVFVVFGFWAVFIVCGRDGPGEAWDRCWQTVGRRRRLASALVLLAWFFPRAWYWAQGIIDGLRGGMRGSPESLWASLGISAFGAAWIQSAVSQTAQSFLTLLVPVCLVDVLRRGPTRSAGPA